ncbi:MAG: type II toxin-antitoxin system VapC family toxin [Acidobacteria bacterium]|nr:type II toxin-antitoxin system VapC family toxin [Acidobacteriota bacterium]
MYAAGREHPLREPCREILGLAAAGRLPAVTSAEVVREILHRFAHIGRRDLGAALASATLDLFAPVLPVTHRIVQRTAALVERCPRLSARDLVHVATCLEEGIGAIVSPDTGFDEVGAIRRIPPGDRKLLARYLR